MEIERSSVKGAKYKVGVKNLLICNYTLINYRYLQDCEVTSTSVVDVISGWRYRWSLKLIGRHF